MRSRWGTPSFTLLTALLISVSFQGNASAAYPGQVIRTTDLAHYSTEEIDVIREENEDPDTRPSKYSVRYIRIQYYTPGIRGNLETASGLLIFPVSKAAIPLLSFQHGAIGLRTEAPSMKPMIDEPLMAMIGFASKGYAVVLPDGLGYGNSSAFFHPFLHADSEASTAIDMIRATQSLFTSYKIKSTGQLFLSGYSQGGHWTMALHRALEQTPLPGLQVVASAAMAGPLDLSDTTLTTVLRQPGMAAGVYTAQLLYTYQQVYGGIVKSWSDAVDSPYDKRIPTLFDGKSSLYRIYRKLGKTPQELLTADYLDAIVHDVNHPFRLALKRNNVFEWVPRAPVLFVHAKSDLECPYINSVVAANYMSQNGANVKLVLFTKKYSHVDAFIPAYRTAAQYFAQFLKSSASKESLYLAESSVAN